MREEILVFTVTALTTLAAYGIGRKCFGFSANSAVNALFALFECIGAFVLFLSINIVLEVTLVFLIRSVMGRFIGLYRIDDVILVILSACQAIAFRLWWRSE